MVGVVHEEIGLSSHSGVIHSHLIALVRHKQAQMCLQSDPKCYEQISTKFLLPYSLTHSPHSLTYSLTHPLTNSPMRSVKCNRKLATSTAWLIWQKCLEFHGKKLFTILNAYMYALFSYGFSFMVAIVS